jgi:outer membrane protein OmpA-like peptidoglycan-associated protein
MSDAPRPGPALACLAAALSLAGCLTPHAKPPTSQAVLDARAHRNEPAAAACPGTAPAAASPLQLTFAFNNAELDGPSAGSLAQAARWLACHGQTAVAVQPQGDGHGSEADQNQLAQRRGEVVASYLSGHGVGADRVRVLGRGAAAPGGDDIFLIRAEGRRW